MFANIEKAATEDKLLQTEKDLILTKPLGVGVITTAIKADVAPLDVADAAIASMTRLNDVGSRLAVEAGATGCTDVTGFGLLGHLGRRRQHLHLLVALYEAEAQQRRLQLLCKLVVHVDGFD